MQERYQRDVRDHYSAHFPIRPRFPPKRLLCSYWPTRPGETVFDGFAGSGTTGLAALLCGDPTPEMRDGAKRLRFDVRWGARNAVLYELSALGAFVGRTLTNPEVAPKNR